MVILLKRILELDVAFGGSRDFAKIATPQELEDGDST
jgi:hypothetical protein